MANMATGQPPPGVVQSSLPKPIPLLPPTPPKLYASFLKPSAAPIVLPTIPAPSMDFHHGEPSCVWEDKDVDNMVLHEELQYAVVGKFSYGIPEFHELKKQIPLQCDIKGECLIGLLESRHVLIRLSLLEDYIHLLSRPAYYVKVGLTFHQMRAMKYDIWFDPREETSIAVAWISFPGLPPVFFVKEAVFALASAMGKPLQLDAATKAKTRPSCAKVKVEVDLLAHRPQRIRIGIKNSISGETRFKWIRIKYEYVPKFCKECRLQGHSEEECYVLHPELIPKEDNVVDVSKQVDPGKVLQSGKVVGNINKGDAIVVSQQVGCSQSTQKKNGDNLEVVQSTHVQGNQRGNGRRFLHPNRNPNAWSRVETKTKQGKEAELHIKAVQMTNSFSMLEREDDTPAKVCEVQHVDKENFQEKEKSVPLVAIKNESFELNSGVSRSSNITPTQVETRVWAQEVFKYHPKVTEVGTSVVSGTGKKQAELVQSNLHAKGISSEINEQTGALLQCHGANQMLKNKVNANGSDYNNQMANGSDYNNQMQQNKVGADHVQSEHAALICTSAISLPFQMESKQIGDHVQQNKVEDGTIILKEVVALSHDENGPACPILNNASPIKCKEHLIPTMCKGESSGRPASAHVTAMDDHMGTQSKELLIPTLTKEWAARPFNDLFKEKNEAHQLEEKNAKQATAQGIEAEGLGLENELIPTALLERLCNMQGLHDLITHKVKPTDVQKAIIEQQQMEEDDDESITENFIQMTKEDDLSPRGRAKSRKRGKKHIQHAEPTRQMTRRMASKSK